MFSIHTVGITNGYGGSWTRNNCIRWHASSPQSDPEGLGTLIRVVIVDTNAEAMTSSPSTGKPSDGGYGCEI